MKVEDVIKKARYILSDTDTVSYKWSDDRLLSLLNDAFNDLAWNTSLFDIVANIHIVVNKSVYDVSSVIFKIDQFVYHNKPLQESTYAEMDKKYGYDWRVKTGITPTTVVYDKRKVGEFRLYPIPSLLEDKDNDRHSYEKYTGSAPYGIIVGLTFYEPPIVLLTDKQAFGGLSTPDYHKYLKLYCTKIPTQVTMISNELESIITPPIIDLLVNFIAGRALKDTIDANYQRKGEQLLETFRIEREQLIRRSSSNGVNAIRHFEYKPFGV